MSLSSVKSNIVQSIRAFTVPYLQNVTQETGQYFLYANLADISSREEAVQSILEQFPSFNNLCGPLSYDALSSSITDTPYKAGFRMGFIVVLEQIPLSGKFDKEARESLLDIFREAADFWAERKIAFRCFYSFSVARSIRNNDATSVLVDSKLTDVSAQALRMSSPFNAGYWLATTNQEETAVL